MNFAAQRDVRAPVYVQSRRSILLLQVRYRLHLRVVSFVPVLSFPSIISAAPSAHHPSMVAR